MTENNLLIQKFFYTHLFYLELRFIMLHDWFLSSLLVSRQSGGMWRSLENLAHDEILSGDSRSGILHFTP